MKTPHRDLLVLVKDDQLNRDAIEFELEQLNQLLFGFETIENLCVAHEAFDMNRYRIVRKRNPLRNILDERELKPFVFLINKN